MFMKSITVRTIKYQIIKDYRDAVDKEAITDNLTDYFDDYDYILGDWASGRLRLKGFCTKENPKYKKLNDYETIENYIKENCAYGCKHFILKKLSYQG